MTMTSYRHIHRLLAIPLSVGLMSLSLGGPTMYAQEVEVSPTPTTSSTAVLDPPQDPEDPAVQPAPTDGAPQTGPTQSTGPTDPTGPQAATGPIGPTGPTVKTGPNGPNGVPCQTGVTYTGGYCQGYSQGTQQGVNQGVSQGATQGVGQNVPASAAGTATGNLGNRATGADSTNTNAVDDTKTTDVAITNTATTTNTVDMSLSTGANVLTGNTSVGSLDTGDIRASLTLVNALNSVFAPGSSVGLGIVGTDANGNIVLSSGTSRALLPTNELTGAGSTNTNAYSGLNAVAIVADNTALVDNDIDIVADTGSNLVDANTTLGDVTTGSIDLAVNLINLLNVFMPDTLFTLDVWSFFGDVAGDLLMENAETGDGSTNTNDVTTTTTTDLTVTNDADSTNAFDVAPTTGGNTFDSNSVVGNVETGDVRVDGSVTNVSNAGAPMFYIVNVLGDWSGGDLGLPAGSFIINELGNLLTGADSTNTNTVDETTTVDVDVTNAATAANSIGIAANTGSNTLSRNTELGNVKTGDVNILANVLNFLNTTGSSLGKFSLGIINILGDWKAKPAPVVPVAATTVSADQSSMLATSPAAAAPLLPLLRGADDTGHGAATTLASAQSGSPTSGGPAVNLLATALPSVRTPSTGTAAVQGSPSTGGTSSVSSPTPNTAASSTVLTAAAERHVVAVADRAAKAVNWQLVIALTLAGLFLASWGAVEVLAARRSRAQG